MLLHTVVKGNISTIKGSEAEAREYAAANGGTYEPRNEYRAWMAESRSDNDGMRSRVEKFDGGRDIIDTIERNFLRIAKGVGLCGGIGYQLKSATITYIGDGKAELVIVGIPHVGKDALAETTARLVDDSEREYRATFEGVSESEIPNGIYRFEVRDKAA